MSFFTNMRPDEKAIVFCGKKARADDLSSEVSLKGIPCQCIHGGREQVSFMHTKLRKQKRERRIIYLYYNI